MSQSFTNDAASNTSVFDLVAGTVLSSHGAKSTLSVSYDAPTGTYTIATSGRSQVFSSSDQIASAAPGEATYKKVSGLHPDHLTLITTPLETQTSNQYVGLGFWQHDQVVGSQQNTNFDIFTYGLDTPASAIPRTGTATYGIDVFGLETVSGLSPKSLRGLGTFDVDFLSSAFSAQAYLTKYDLVNDSSEEGGQILAGGHLSSRDGTFSGNMSFRDTGTLMAGTVGGRFYGPTAQELGATFAGDDANGNTVVGGFTGVKGTGIATTNLTLTNIVASQRFYTSGNLLEIKNDESGTITGANLEQLAGQFTVQPDGSFVFAPGPGPELSYATFTSTDKVSGDMANFTTYRKQVADDTVQVSLYNPGPGNSELALTYASFGIWQQTGASSQIQNPDNVYFAYGIATPYGALTRRTGTAHYAGVAYGGAVDSEVAARYALTGTSKFDVDFGAQDYSGALVLHGTQEGSGAARDFGTFTFAGQVGADGSTATVSQNSQSVGNLVNHFYGPDAEEVAGTFTMVTGNPNKPTILSGVTAAKRQ